MPNAVRLQAGERVPGRPFADPERSGEDLERLEYMLHRVRRAVGLRVLFDQPDESGGNGHIVRVYDANTLREAKTLHFVGFRGFRHARPDPGLIEAVQKADRRVSRELAHRAILAYSSLELDGSDWINLVLLRCGEDKARIHDSPAHRYAAGELAPRLYRHIRLHSGSLGGLWDELRLECTQYYDFCGDGPWFGVRT